MHRASAGAPVDRQDQGPASVRLSSLYLQEFGATVGESAGEHLVIGSTARLVRGSFASAPSAAADASLDRAEALEGGTDTHADLDLGAMAIFGAVRLAIVAKHVTQPTFVVGADRIDLRRQVRTGIAVMSAERGAVGPFTIAFDADLTRTATAVGDIRHWSVGSEAWVANRRLGARGGFAANTVGDARPSVSGGVSLGLRRGFYVDGQLTGGSDETLKGWGVALRLTF